MTSLSSVILSGAKNLHSCRLLARKFQIDPLPSLPFHLYFEPLVCIIISSKLGRDRSGAIRYLPVPHHARSMVGISGF